MARKSTIGVNPLDAVIPIAAGKGVDKPVVKKRPQKAAEPDIAIHRERLTILIPLSTVERARNAAYWDRVPLAQIVDEALTAAIDRMEKARGEPYPERSDALRAGRPLKRR